MFRNIWFAIFLGIVLQFADVDAKLKCYTCTSQGQSTPCELNPKYVAGGITDCDKRYCTLRRIELKTTNEVQSFYRNCEDNPVYIDKIIEDDTYRTFFQACSSELCNGGTGRDSYVPGGQGNLPAGVTKPPFNNRVLHAFSTAAIQSGIQVSVLVISLLTAVCASFFVLS